VDALPSGSANSDHQPYGLPDGRNQELDSAGGQVLVVGALVG
jgi:hypothetical protein